MTIQQIQANDVTATYRALFRTDEPHPTRLRSVLTGVTEGKLFTDDPLNPTWGIVQESFDGCIYLGGTPEPATIVSVIANLRRECMVLAPLWLNDPRRDLLPNAVGEESFSIDFYDRPLGEGLVPYLHAVPADCTIRRADRELIMRTEWGPGDVDHHGGLDAWEQQCICFCLLRGEEILSEASVGPGVDRLREPGVFTQEAHRGKGYGTLVAAHLIHHLEALGESTYWSCDSENYASAGIGRKLGYRVEKGFRVLAWSKVS
ncbi:MAG: GNAT family N-acetyltransferase [Caldilineaceae bacterium]|nr:GNAT family N-acetyltransferase [Caldilineaceae bacterium]